MKKDDKGDSVKKKKSDIPVKTKKSSVLKKSLKIIFTVLLLAILIGGGTAIAMVLSVVQDAPDFDPSYLRPAETSYVYDDKGNEVAKLHHDQNRTIVPLNMVPDHVQDAFIAIEDERFEDHFGVDIIGIIRASVVNFRHRKIVQGASTITQQLIRNAFLTPEQTVERKIQEAWLAMQIEREYTKNEILEMYLNLIYFGNGVYGIEAASETYFKKSVVDLTTAEAAMLAGIPSSPNFNNPIYSEERAVNRMKTVINKMAELEYITSAQASEYRQEHEEFSYGEVRTPEYPYPHFIDYVIHDELTKVLTELPEYETKEEAYSAIYNRGLRVFTTLDAELQEHVENTLNDNDKYPSTFSIDMDKFRDAYREAGGNIPGDFPDAYLDEENGIPQPQSAMVLADPSTGKVRALGGGRDYRKQGNEVLRFASKRQPGSAIKPIISYAPAFEEGLLTPGSIVEDTYFSVGGYTPRSWDGQYWGDITVREAIKWSRNIPAVRVLQMVSPAKGTEYAEKMGITSFSDDDRGSLAAALGGVSGISVYDMTQAFATIANMGIKKPLHTIERIEDSSGNIIFQQEALAEPVLSPQTAYMINDILEETHRTTFTSNRLYIDRPVAVKTGTTNDNRDTYLAAYTPNFISVFWMGYDFHKMGRIHGGHGLSTAITREVFEKAFTDLGLEIVTFEEQRPAGLASLEICTKSGKKATDLCRRAGTTRRDLFTSDNAPEDFCDGHVSCEICEASGLLPGPYCPHDSINEEVFFEGGSSDDEPPEDQCDVHTEEPEKPTSFNASWNESSGTVNLNWSAPAGENIKEYRIFRASDQEDRSLLATVRNTRYVDSGNIREGASYTYTLYAVSQDNTLSPSVTARVTIPAEDEDNGENDDEDNNNNPPASPSLYSPNNGHTGAPLTPTLYWNSSEGADSYTVEVSSNDSFTDIVASSTVNNLVFTLGQELSAGTRYWWRVKAKNNAGESNWSSARSFTTEEPSDTAELQTQTIDISGINFFDNLLERAFLERAR